MLVVSLLMGGVALLLLAELHRKGARERSLATIREAGGLYAEVEKGGSSAVVSIDFDAFVVDDTGTAHRRGRVGDALLPMLTSFPWLRALSLQDAEVTDAGIRQLARLENLRSLNLRRTRITDEALSHLAMTRLTWLDVRETMVTREGVEQLHRALKEAEILSDFD
jgi:hypothetical protein